MKKLFLATTALVLCFSVTANAAPAKAKAAPKETKKVEQKVEQKAEKSGVEAYASAKFVYTDFHLRFQGDEKSQFNAYGGEFAVGAKLTDNIRAEFAYTYRNPSKRVYEDEGYEMGMQSYMINGYYDFSTGTAFKPYVSVGAGMARVKVVQKDYSDRSNDYSASENTFAYSFGAGVSYDVTDDVAIDAGYRYTRTRKIFGYDADSDESFATKQYANDFMIGVRYTF